VALAAVFHEPLEFASPETDRIPEVTSTDPLLMYVVGANVKVPDALFTVPVLVNVVGLTVVVLLVVLVNVPALLKVLGPVVELFIPPDAEKVQLAPARLLTIAP
jgi:hypothetical protein